MVLTKKMTLQQVQKYATTEDKKHTAGKSFVEQVKVKHGDGSTFKLRFAKSEIKEMYLIVYSEHNGIQYFHCEDIKYAKTKKLFTKGGKRSRSKYKTLVDNEK